MAASCHVISFNLHCRAGDHGYAACFLPHRHPDAVSHRIAPYDFWAFSACWRIAHPVIPNTPARRADHI
ncbi:hypothetical protein KCP76_09515 [Salmonella enterica subsp. enterica serovar Weltevreden]|nr:hypothetical protein KCP76_09515 [Salmonella enterica subsp. enterica serovar Weltevreden]